MNFTDLYRERTVEMLGLRTPTGLSLRSADTSGIAVRVHRDGESRFACRPIAATADATALAAVLAEYDDTELRREHADLPLPMIPVNTADQATVLRAVADSAWAGTLAGAAQWATVEVWCRARARSVVASDLPAATESGALYRIAVRCRSGDGRGYRVLAGRDLDTLTAETAYTAGRNAAAQAAALNDADRPITGRWPIVLGPFASALLVHELVGHGLEGDTAARGSALWKRRNETVAPTTVTVLDDNSRPDAWEPATTDDEGQLCRAATLIDNGVVRGVLADRTSAAALPGLAPTGHARRTGFAEPPQPRVRHTVLESGATPSAELIGTVADGIEVDSAEGADANPSQGRFTLRARSGWRIVHGERRQRLRDFTVEGSLDVLGAIAGLGDDPMTSYGMCGRRGGWAPVSFSAPTVLLDNGTIRGRETTDAR
jgi:predicted Zn-dependent protease